MANTGARAGASSQPHSMIRSKNVRTIPIRRRSEFAASGVPLGVTCTESASLKLSMWARSSWAKLLTPGWACTRWRQNTRSARSAGTIVAGRQDNAIWPR
jgi:hypothetical protein